MGSVVSFERKQVGSTCDVRRVLLLGDSTVLGSVPRGMAPGADQLEDVIRKRVAGDAAMPRVVVINKGQDNDTIHRMLETRYERDVLRLEGGPCDFVFIRFGINDRFYLRDFFAEFRPNYLRLLARLRGDWPQARVTLETVIPYAPPGQTGEVNSAIRAVAREAGLDVLDTHAAYAAALRASGPHMLNYRRAALGDVPESLRQLLPAGSVEGETVTVLDHTLDAHFSDVPGWFADRHPNHAGFHVIGRCVAEYLRGVMVRG